MSKHAKVLLENHQLKEKEQFVSSILKDLTNTHETNQLNLSQIAGRPVRVELFPQSSESLQIKPSHLSSIKNDLNLSDNQTLKLAKNIRVATMKRKAVGSGLSHYLVESKDTMKECFTLEECSFTKGAPSTPIIVCKNFPLLVKTIESNRNTDGRENDFKIGIDGGGGFLKICLNIIEHACKQKREVFILKVSGQGA